MLTVGTVVGLWSANGEPRCFDHHRKSATLPCKSPIQRTLQVREQPALDGHNYAKSPLMEAHSPAPSSGSSSTDTASEVGSAFNSPVRGSPPGASPPPQPITPPQQQQQQTLQQSTAQQAAPNQSVAPQSSGKLSCLARGPH